MEFDFEMDTIIVPATPQGFQEVFLEQHAWWALQLANSKLKQLKYIAVYQKRPISAITHYAAIGRIEKYKDTDKYAIYFVGPLIELKPIKYDKGSVPPQKQRYTTLKKLLSSGTLSDILGL